MSVNDEELARRLQMEEHSKSGFREVARPTQADPDHLDPELARYYARLYLEQQGQLAGSTSYPVHRQQQQGPPNMYRPQVQGHDPRYNPQISMNPSTPPFATQQIGPSSDYYARNNYRQQNPYEFDRTVPRSRSSLMEDFSNRNVSNRGWEPVSSAAAAASVERPGPPDSRPFEGAQERRASLDGRSGPIAGMHSTYPLNTPGAPAYPRNFPGNSENNEISPGKRRVSSIADIEYARQLQEKAFLNLQQNQAHAAQKLQSNVARLPGASPADLEYARRLQELAFSDLNRKNPPNQQMQKPAPYNHSANHDAEIARKMQALENKGLGRLNSDRKIKSIEDDPDDSDSGRDYNNIKMPGQMFVPKQSAVQAREEKDAQLARFIQDSDISLSHISSDELNVAFDSAYPTKNEPRGISPEQSQSTRRVHNMAVVKGNPNISEYVRDTIPVVKDYQNISENIRVSKESFSMSPGSILYSPSDVPQTPRNVSTSSISSDVLLSPHEEERNSEIGSDDLSHSNPATSTKNSLASLPEVPIHGSPAKEKKKRGFLGFGSRTTSSSDENKKASKPQSGQTLVSLIASSQSMALKNASKKSVSSGSSPVGPSSPSVPLRNFLGSGAPPKAIIRDASGGRSIGSVSSTSGTGRDSHGFSPGVNIKPPKGISVPYNIPLREESSAPPTKMNQQRGDTVGVPPRGIPPPPTSSHGLYPPMSRGDPVGVPPRGIPPPPSGPPGALGHQSPMNLNGNGPVQGKSKFICAGCGLGNGPFLKALDKKYHADCFRCVTCNGKIDPNSPFKFSSDPLGEKHPHHLDCYVRMNGIVCSVCRQLIPTSPDGRVAFVKHPFFATEHMCVHHVEVPHRRCSGCQRFEPDDKPFIDLMDDNRCICPACCRTVIFDHADTDPLWKQVIYFFEFKLKLPVWDEMREIPILLVGSDELSSQMRAESSIHMHSSQIMTSGLCLTAPIPDRFGQRNVVAIVCLSGLPRDLTLSILLREATLAWFKLHPKYDCARPLEALIEEGIAQLIAFLFLSEETSNNNSNELTEGSSSSPVNDESEGPSDEKLRQYYKFTIERDSNEIYGNGYRKAAMSFREVGIEELMDYAVKYGEFPRSRRQI